MRKLYIQTVVLAAIAWVFSGCPIFSLTETVDFSMETEALCRNAGGDFQGIEVFCLSSPEIESHIRVDSNCREFSFSPPKNYVSAVLAYPLVDGFRKRPLGAVYPYSCRLDVTGGFVAEVLARVYRLSEGSGVQDYLTRFNWQRLYDECAVYEDPWVLDMDRIVRAIAKGSFRKSDIQIKNYEL